jgi:hypothetical protein
MILLAVAARAGAQDDLEYRMEIGAGLGMVSYEGDFNGNILKDMQPMASVILRRDINPYMALRLSANYGKLKGSSADVDTYYPDYATNVYTFDNTLIDVSATYEYNFWPYGTGHDYRGAKRITPYIFIGLGATCVTGGGNTKATANMPLGLGVKYKLAERLNLGVEWAMHFSLSDELDGVKDPYGVQSSGIFKNTDCYSALQLTLTYSFSPKCRTCNKDY